MMQPKRVLLWNVPMYDFYWTMTAAQIDIIVSDKPISYIKSDKKKFAKPSARKINEAIEKYKQRKNGITR